MMLGKENERASNSHVPTSGLKSAAAEDKLKSLQVGKGRRLALKLIFLLLLGTPASGFVCNFRHPSRPHKRSEISNWFGHQV
jgi:hypothetical protein